MIPIICKTLFFIDANGAGHGSLGGIEKNDILILIKGAHGFKILEPTDILEIKQGPYNHKKDKIRFQPIDAKKIKLK